MLTISVPLLLQAENVNSEKEKLLLHSFNLVAFLVLKYCYCKEESEIISFIEAEV